MKISTQLKCDVCNVTIHIPTGAFMESYDSHWGIFKKVYGYDRPDEEVHFCKKHFKEINNLIKCFIEKHKNI